MFKIAIIGMGSIATAHTNAIAAHPELEVSAVCDINEERAKSFAEKLGVPYFLDYKDIPSSVECDAVILNLPHGLHKDAAIFFLDNGIHVLVEKPMANTVEECDAMIAAAQKNGKKLAIAHPQRFSRANMFVKEIIDSGKLGRICMYNEQRSINYFDPKRPAWFTNKKMAGGGIVMNYGAHAFDRICSFTGARPTEVFAGCDNFLNDKDVEGHAQILAKFDNGMTASVTFSGYNTVLYENVLYFSNGAIIIRGINVDVKVGDGKWETTEGLHDGKDFVRELDAFYKYVKGEPSEIEIPDPEFSRSVIEAIQKAYNA
ncbi:MAG: Gfo/Idh/MocA family oxidoreductase [Clostridia bacterium]|nr:Gfo/Idh/MocA family oxidoreductase [Clostridia bacterium]